MKIIIRKPYSDRFEYSDADFDGWEFVVSGEASQTPMHEWNCGFMLGREKRGNGYALKLLEYGCGDESGFDDDDEDQGPYMELAAVMIDPAKPDESWIARRLIKEYRDAGGKYIEMIHECGEFDLENLYGNEDEACPE